MSSGAVTLKSVTTTPPADWNWHPVTQTLWLTLEFRNTSDSTVTVAGFRGAPEPTVFTTKGAKVLTTAKSTTFSGGTGGFGPGQPESISLSPGGVVRGEFGAVVATGTAASVNWQPIGEPGATFDLR